MGTALLLVVFILVVVLDVTKKLPVTTPWLGGVLVTLLSHVVGMGALLFTSAEGSILSSIGSLGDMVLLVLFGGYVSVRLHLYVARDEPLLPRRLRILMGGRRLLLVGLFGSIAQVPLAIGAYHLLEWQGVHLGVIIADIVVAVVVVGSVLLDGLVRVFVTSTRLRVVNRVLMFLLVLVPLVNIAVVLYLARLVGREYHQALDRARLQEAREEAQICKTTYPLLLLHGIGFRDTERFNYWGRIPALLKRNGATVHYGGQHAWGTIENNAREIKDKIEEILATSSVDKVNIIAHSKGGLDARYVISSLGMAEHVASLTTICTPHRGSELIVALDKLGDKRYRRIASWLDKHFLLLGDTTPDVYASSRQLHPTHLEEFNRDTPDAPEVYYQSYADKMEGAGSDKLLSVPYLVMKLMTGDNDGLVSVESAKWGEYKGLLSSDRDTGLSHGGAIDLMWKDRDGFDIMEKYVAIVAELVTKGF